MKKTLTILLFFLTSTCLLSQKVDFKKDLAPIIKTKDYSADGAAKAEIYIQQNSKPSGELTENAILLNYEKVYSAKVYLANCFYKEGSEKRDIGTLQSALKHFKEASEFLANDISEAVEGKTRTENLINEIVEFNKAEEKRKVEIAKQAEIDRQKVIQDSLNESSRLKKEELEKNQEKFRLMNTGANDPMIVAKKYAQAYISGDIETLISLGYVDSTSRKVGILKQKTIDSYRADKSKFTPQMWKSEVLKYMINTRISRDYNPADYKKANICGTHDNEHDDIQKPLIKVRYESENEVVIHNIISFDYKEEKCNYLGNEQWGSALVVKHRRIYLIKKNGKWFVKDLN